VAFSIRPLAPALVLGCALALSACQPAEEKAEEHYQSALALLEAGDTDRALVELRNVFRFDASHREGRRKLGDLMRARGDRQGAYSQYLRLAEQYPDDLEARIALAEIAFSLGNWDEMERHSAKAEELAPDDPRVQALVAARAYRAAVIAEDDAARREAARAADALLDGQPDSTFLRAVVIDNAVRERNYDRALSEIDTLIARDPGNKIFYQQRLQVLAQSGDTDALEAQLRDTVERFPDDKTLKATLLRFYISQNDLDAAEAFLRELVAAAGSGESGPRIDLIRFLAEKRGTEAARAEIDAAIAEQTDPVPFQVFGAGLDFAAGQRDAAIATLESVLAGAEPSEQTRNIKVTLARMLLTTGNEVGARTRVEEVLAEDPNQPEALKMQAAWLIEADDTDGAIAALRTALDRASEDAQAMTLMAEAYTRSGRPELARDYLSLAVEASGNAPAESIRYARLLIREESYLPAEDILLAALRLAPDNGDLLVTLGDLYLRMEDFGRAQNVEDTLRRIGDPAAEQAANRIAAERLRRQDGADQAMAFLEDLASGSDASLASKITLIQARIRSGDVDGALSLAETLQRENPDNPVVEFVLAAAHAVKGDLDTAEEIYRKLLAANPALPRVWLELVRVLQFQGDRDAAKEAVAEGLSHLPENAQLLWAQASFLEQDGDIDGAIAVYEDLYARNSGTVVVANNLASLLATYRDDAESLERAWTIARRLRDVKFPAMQDTYGWIAHRRGDSAEALPYLEAAAEALPGDPMVHYHLGQVYLALDRSEEARAQFVAAVEIAGPADRRAQIEEARRLVQTLPAAPQE